MADDSSSLILYCIPIYNDWACALELLDQIDRVAAEEHHTAAVLFVDDGSSQPYPQPWPRAIRALRWVRVLELRRNLGHQRAIAIGLTYIQVNLPCRAVVVMDGDGEDAPRDVPALLHELQNCGHEKVVFAKRARRTETLMFKFFYWFYKSLHRALTGRKVEVGNFSVIPSAALSRLVGVGEIWNHYAASVYKSRFPCTMIPIARSHRLVGTSRMNFTSLVVHGLSAISIFGDEIGVRLLVASSVLIALTILGILTVIGIRLFTDLAIPEWATTSLGLIMVMFANGLLLSLIFVFIILQTRNSMTFLPLRDYAHYVLNVVRVAGDE